MRTARSTESPSAMFSGAVYYEYTNVYTCIYMCVCVCVCVCVYTIFQYTLYENIHLHSIALGDVFGRSKEDWCVCEEEARVRLTQSIVATN
jgi:hypothetical protein